MDQHIMVGEWGYAIDTDEERAEAVAAMREANVVEVKVFAGDFADDSSCPNGQRFSVNGEVVLDMNSAAMTPKTYGDLIAELEAASIALRYCTNSAERPALAKAKLAAESAIEAFNDAESAQDLVNGT
jgi:hypothetical protein